MLSIECEPHFTYNTYAVFFKVFCFIMVFEKNIYKHILITLLCYKNNEFIWIYEFKKGFSAEYGVRSIYCSFFDYKKVFVYIMMYKERVLEHILLMLQYFKYDEADIHHLDLLQDIFSWMLFTSHLLFIIREL